MVWNERQVDIIVQQDKFYTTDAKEPSSYYTTAALSLAE